MRVKVEFDEKFALAKGVKRVWFEVFLDSMATIGDCALAIGKTFGFDLGSFEIELDGFLLLGGQTTASMLREDCTVRVVRASNSLWSPLKTMQWRGKIDPPKNGLLHREMPPSHKKNARTSTTSTSSTSSSSPTDSSSTSASTTPTTSESSSESSSTSHVTSAQQEEPEISPTSNGITKQRRKRMNKRNRLAMQRARVDTLTNLSRVYRNQMDVSEVDMATTTTDYESLPKVSLGEIQIGQVVAWRQLVLSPTFTATMSPFQERQLVSISPEGLQFRIVSPETFLSSWWYNDDGEKVCTVREWMETNGETLEPEITLPMDPSSTPDDLRLLHNADIV